MKRRDFVRDGAWLASGLLGGGIFGSAAQAAIEDSRLKLVHPELRKIAAGILVQAFPKITTAALPDMRKFMNRWARPRLPSVSVDQRSIKGLTGQPDVTVYVINASAGANRPAILHTHGGGFISGTASFDVPGLQELALAADCTIVTVEYRLAPETRWNGSCDDTYAALIWLHQNAESLGVDPARLAVMGESAGGGHAALLALNARDRGEVPLIFQCLTYPMLDDRTASTRPVPPHMGQIAWTAESNRFGWGAFLGQAPGTKQVPSAAVPARHLDLKGLPPTFIGVGSIDLFFDEDLEYAHRLGDAGVPVELNVVPGAFHGFELIGANTRVAATFVKARLEALRLALHPNP